MASFFNMKGITGNEFQIGLHGPIITNDKTNNRLSLSDTYISNLITGAITPLTNGNLNIGSDSLKYNIIYANTFNGNATTATTADKVKNSINIKFNGGSTEDTDLFTYNGSTSKTIDISLTNLGAAASDHNHDDTYVNITGDTMTGTLNVPQINDINTSTVISIATGTNNNSFFQAKKFRGEGNASTYYHAIDFGYTTHDRFDFYEYGGIFNFWRNQSSSKLEGDTNRVASLQLGKLLERGNTLTYPGKSGTLALTSDIEALDVSDTAVDNQYLTSVSETDGKISITRKQIDYNELSNTPTNLSDFTNDQSFVTDTELKTSLNNYLPLTGGTITNGSITIDNSNSNLILNDVSTTRDYSTISTNTGRTILIQGGNSGHVKIGGTALDETVTFAVEGTSKFSQTPTVGTTKVALVTDLLTIGTSSTSAAAGNHTHTLSLSKESDSSGSYTTTSLLDGTTYKLTSGGNILYFTTPAAQTFKTIKFKNASNSEVSYNGTGEIDLTGGVYYSVTSGTASSCSGNAATASNATNLNGQAASYYLNYNNFTNKPTLGTAASKNIVDAGDSVESSLTSLTTGKAVKEYVASKISGVYQFKGTIDSVTTDSNGNITPSSTVTEGNGYIYNVKTQFTYLGETYPAGTNIVCEKDVNSGTTETTIWKPLGGVFDIDLSSYQPLDQDLTNISALSGTGRVTRSSSGTYTLDNNNYAKSSSNNGSANNIDTTADTTNTLYLTGVTSAATTTLKRNTGITMKNDSLTAGTITATTLKGGWSDGSNTYTNSLATQNTTSTNVPVIDGTTLKYRSIPLDYNNAPSTLSVASAVKASQNSNGSPLLAEENLGKKTFEVILNSSVSTSRLGTWSAMCYASSTGSPTLPDTTNWWHVLSLNWDSTDVSNWTSQLALPTRKGGVPYYRSNNTAGQDISSSTWYKFITEENIAGQTVSKATTADTATNIGSLTNNDDDSNANVNFTIGDKSYSKTINNVSHSTTSDKWSNAKTITLEGAVTGSVSLDGSANVTLTTTSNHTHNYAGSASAGGTAYSANKAFYLESPATSRLTSADLENSEEESWNGKCILRIDEATSSMTTKPGEGFIYTNFWDNTNYDSQLFLPISSSDNLAFRVREDKPSWGTWSDIAYVSDIDTKLSNWSGSSNITTVGTITSGTWSGTSIASKNISSTLDRKTITNSTYNGYTLNAACAKNVVTSIDTTDSLPTSNAVKTFVEGKNYITSSHTHDSLYQGTDTRTTATKESDYNGRVIKWQGLKVNSTIGTPSYDSYSYLIGLMGWSNNSGGHAHELAFNNSGISHRIANSTEAWDNWKRVAYTSSTVAAANKVTNSLSFSDGTSYNGSKAKTVTYSTVGAAASDHSHSFSSLSDWDNFYTTSATKDSTSPITSGGVYNIKTDLENSIAGKQAQITSSNKLSTSLLTGTIESSLLPDTVVYTAAAQALTNKIYNGLSISTANSPTLTIKENVSFDGNNLAFNSHTLTVNNNYTLNSACAASLITTKNSTASDSAVMSEKLADATYQPKATALTNLVSSASSTTTGFLKKSEQNTWSIDTNSYSTTSHGHGQINSSGVLSSAISTTNNYSGSELVLAYGGSGSSNVSTEGTLIRSTLEFNSSASNLTVLSKAGKFVDITDDITTIASTQASGAYKYTGIGSSTSKLYIVGTSTQPSTVSSSSNYAQTLSNDNTWVQNGTIHGTTVEGSTEVKSAKVSVGTVSSGTVTSKVYMQYNSSSESLDFVFA